MRHTERHRPGVDEGPDAMAAYDQWLTWEDSLRVRREKPGGTSEATPVAPQELEWGDQSLVEASLALVGPHATELVAFFYESLFADQPGLRSLFPDDLSDQGERLLAALIALVHDAQHPDALVERLQQLGRDHRRYGARPAHYAAVGRALIAALTEFAGDAWTPPVAQAWQARYTVAADVMMAAADADPQPPYWYASVVAHERLAPDLAVVRVLPHHPYAYVSGQWAMLAADRRRRSWRPYLMATAPTNRGELEFHVRATGTGGLSDTLVHDTSVDDTVRVGPPLGTGQLRPAGGRIPVFVESDLGWAPTRALLEELALRGEDASHQSVLVHVGPDAPYDPHWAEVCRRCPGLSTVVINRPDEVGPFLAQIDPDRLDLYVSGDEPFTTAVAERLVALGVPAQHTTVTAWSRR